MLAPVFDDFHPACPQHHLCISLSARPGKFGTTVHNAGYRALKLPYTYQAFSTQHLEAAIQKVRALQICGCSISMPFKERVLAYIDSLDPAIADLGAVNTIVNRAGCLHGYNTDVTGVVEAFTPYLTSKKAYTILLLGGGGAARAIIKALQSLDQHHILLCVRDTIPYQSMAKQFQITLLSWSCRHDVAAEILINATPLGMSDKDLLPIDIQLFKALHLVVDVVVAQTALIQAAKKTQFHTIDGITIALYQAYQQFYLYTGQQAPRDVMKRAAMALF